MSRDVIIASEIIDRFMQKNNLKRFNLFDIGAHEGNYSKTFLEKINSKEKEINLVLVEPNKAFNNSLKEIKNIKEKEIYNCAIDSKEGYANLHIVKESTSKSSLINRPEFKQLNYDDPEKLKVRTKTLKSVLDASNIFNNLSENSAYLKIDIEGFEKEAIESLTENYFKYFIGGQFEYGGTWKERNISAKSTIRYLFKYYDIFIQKNNNSLEHINPDNFVENFVYSNVFFFKKSFAKSFS